MHAPFRRVLPALIVIPAALAQPAPVRPAGFEPPQAQLTPESLDASVRALVGMAEGDARDQWPYEGVYRVNREIPVGYRIGGTAIVVEALAQAPGYDADEARKAAVERGLGFIIETRAHPLMSEADYDGGYDVRGWGYVHGLHTLARLKRLGLIPASLGAKADEAARWYADALQKIEIPGPGGWNYARPAGRKNPGQPSPFMTGSALRALFEAKEAGYEIDPEVVERGLSALERSRTDAGSVVYSGVGTGRVRPTDSTPGAVGRILTVEATLALAGRSDTARVRGAVDAFIVHWGWLEARRAKPGTHEGPYAVAPYYFMFAHHAAAQAVELLPVAERAEYRRRINNLLGSVRSEHGTWNDRVFARSSGYGTAMALLAIHAPTVKPPSRWTPAPANAPAPGAGLGGGGGGGAGLP
ncbi:MAG: terpene cyclase/mutase family protein [Phycisphaeraceae bacterium]|nr:MAG: terpene cyclase/mutase family protein [Phycisphaeraceae bacterium]